MVEALGELPWEGAILGQGATTTWVWQRDPGESLGHCILTRANCTEALGKVTLDLLRLANEVVTRQQIKPEIALLMTPASIPCSEDYLDEMKYINGRIQRSKKLPKCDITTKLTKARGR